jgi:hypothetical protein
VLAAGQYCIVNAGSWDAELEGVKEEIGYLKLWLGVMVITDISLVGWIVSNAGRASIRLFTAGCLAAILVTGGILYLHYRTWRRIGAVREL